MLLFFFFFFVENSNFGFLYNICKFENVYFDYVSGAVCRQAGHRFGDHVERVVPLVLKYAQVEDDELREHCLQACENMVYKCGKEITPHIPTITKLCLVNHYLHILLFIVYLHISFIVTEALKSPRQKTM